MTRPHTDRRRRPDPEGSWCAARGDRLREREDFLSEMRGVFAGTWEHPTGAIVVEGSPGLGKTAMVNAGCHIASSLGLCVLRTRAVEGEAEVPFGVVRYLLARVVPQLAADDVALPDDTDLALRLLRSGARTGTEATDVFRSLDSLLSQLRTGPTLLAVDDVHWADAESVAWLQYLARWLPASGLRMLVSTRPRRAGVPLSTADRLVSEPSTRVFSLQPLSPAVVGDLVSGYLGEPADASFANACHEITGGTPSLVVGLLHALDAHAVPPVECHVPRLDTLSSPTVARSVLQRLSSAAPGTLSLLEAVAVLGARADLRVAAALAAIDGNDAGRIADSLADASLLRSGRPLEFVHRFVRSSVYSEIPPARRSSAHAEAAQLLAASGLNVDEAAAHLLETEPQGNPWVVAELIRAGRAAVDRNDLQSAGRYLQRATAEPPQGEQQAMVLQIRAEIEALLGHSEAVDHFREAGRCGVDAMDWAYTGLKLVDLLWYTPHVASIIDLLRSTKEELAVRDPDGLARLELIEAVLPRPAPMPRRIDARLAALTGSCRPERTPTGRLVSAYVAAAAAADPLNSKIDEIVEVIRTALTPKDMASSAGSLAVSVMTEALGVLVRAGRGDVAEPILRTAKLGADERGEAVHSAAFAVVLGQSLASRAPLREAEGLVLGALACTRDVEGPTYDRAMLVWIQILVALGDLDRASEAFAGVRVDEWNGAGLFDRTLALETRGRLNLLSRRWDMALEDFDASGVLSDEQGILNPALTSWRVGKCQALAELGRLEEAVELSDENLRLAQQFGAAVPIAVALRCAARLAPGPQRISLLTEALGSLKGTPDELERCGVLIELGRATREAGDLLAARRLLSVGGDLAVRVGAGYLAGVANEELRAAGARPRRLSLSGVGALTPAERRVILLAAQGRTNSTIALTLFVSVKTVESHVTRSYRKLGITSRSELVDVLGPNGHLA